MQGQGQFERYFQSGFVGIVYGTATQVVGHERAGVDVVVVVIGSVALAVDRVRHACPLCPVAGSFQVAGQAAGAVSAHNVAHTTAETDRVGTDHAFLFAFVAQYDHAVVIGAFVKFEGAQVDPCTASYLLVDFEFGDSTVVEDQVFGIGYAFRKGLVADIYGVAAFFGDIRNPFGKGFFRFGLCRDKTGGPVGERIVSVPIDQVFLGESRLVRRLPLVFLVVDFQIFASRSAGVVVDDDFLPLPVPFAGCEHYGAGILQHRNQVGYYDGLGKEVFGGSEQARSLPDPLLLVVLVITAVALPDGQVTVLKSSCNLKRTGSVGYPRISFVVDFPVLAAFVFLLGAEGVRYQVLDGLSVGIDGQVVIVDRSRKELFQAAVDGGSVFFSERLVAEILVGVYIQPFLVVVHDEFVQSGFSDVGVTCLVVREEFPESVFNIFLEALCLQDAYCPRQADE